MTHHPADMISWENYEPLDTRVANRSFSGAAGRPLQLRVAPKRTTTKWQMVRKNTPKKELHQRLNALVLFFYIRSLVYMPAFHLQTYFRPPLLPGTCYFCSPPIRARATGGFPSHPPTSFVGHHIHDNGLCGKHQTCSPKTKVFYWLPVTSFPYAFFFPLRHLFLPSPFLQPIRLLRHHPAGTLGYHCFISSPTHLG